MVERPIENAPVCQENVIARIDQETSVVVIGESVAPSLKGRAAARIADVRSVQVPEGVQLQRLANVEAPIKGIGLRLRKLRRA